MYAFRLSAVKNGSIYINYTSMKILDKFKALDTLRWIERTIKVGNFCLSYI